MRNLTTPVYPLRKCLAVAFVALLAAAVSGHAQTASYLPFEELTAELRTLAASSDAARLYSVGTSREGREIWVVELGALSDPPREERPAVLVVGNLQGNHLLGSALALGVVRYFLGTPDDPEARAALDEILSENTIYVFPRLNPDGAEARFEAPAWDRAGNARPHDDDNDGRVDEDGSEDLNGDGLITVMRVADPAGAYMPDPGEPRLMRAADPAEGETGKYTLYREGADSDGDGFLNEDGPGGVDLDRNFQHQYAYFESDVGPHMVSEPETRALMDFVVSHRNIAAILAFGLSDNLVTPPDSRGDLAEPRTLDLRRFADASLDDVFEAGVFEAEPRFGFGGFGFIFGGRGSGFRGAQPGRDNDPDSGRRPATSVDDGDREYFEAVSDAYRSVTGIERLGVTRKAEGAFFEYGYYQYGVPSFSTPGWGLPTADAADAEIGGETGPAAGRGGRPGRSGGQGIDGELLESLEAAGIDAFVDWTPYQHPTLGEVEIGGFRPYAVANPPPEALAELGRKHGEFVARLAGMLPRILISETEVTAHGGGIFTVEAEIVNSGYFPSALRHGVVSRSIDPVTVQIQVPPEALVTGDPKTASVRALDGSGSRERFVWVIRGSPGAEVEIRVRSQKGGGDSVTVRLR